MRPREGLPDPIFGGTRGESREREAAVGFRDARADLGLRRDGCRRWRSSSDADYREVPNTTSGGERE